MHFGIGVIGATGFIGTPYRQEIREASAALRIIALCARRQDLLEQAGAQDNATLITNDWQEVIHHSEVNLVLICTPDALHHEALLSCAKAGKYVFCEKPVGTNVQQAFDMYTAVQQAGLAHYVPFWSRYQRVLQQAKQILTSGRLGDIRGVVYRWHNPRPLGMPFTWRDDAALSSAGIIADVGSHAFRYDAMAPGDRGNSCHGPRRRDHSGQTRPGRYQSDRGDRLGRVAAREVWRQNTTSDRF